jgi:hypothetical protein
MINFTSRKKKSLQVRKGALTEAAMLYSSTKGSFVK